ncbi:unnamed protein product [Brachionus calyciflorus]|uniref:MAM domain-containing protein n=1 Tax=Brachionus calyciflorus TaxID=104777 RepID=A0A813Y6F4_9BILA|nr:unnamed protein product [Brachionus calyciflorus]
MITSDKYEKSNGSFRSRFISPVYYLKDEPKVFYMTFSYNIYGNVSDGFNLIIENYLNMNESINLLTISGPLKENKWHLASLKLMNLDKFAHEFRFIFEPFRGKSNF